jgi:gliding motility-associated-like protein
LFYVPNTFTPDGDEFNNVFIPYISGNIIPETYSMSIYNRWGELIFQTKDINIGWDGSYSLARKCQDGVYTWEIEFKSRTEAEVFKKHGFVNLIR